MCLIVQGALLVTETVRTVYQLKHQEKRVFSSLADKTVCRQSPRTMMDYWNVYIVVMNQFCMSDCVSEGCARHLQIIPGEFLVPRRFPSSPANACQHLWQCPEKTRPVSIATWSERLAVSDLNQFYKSYFSL